MGFCTANLPTLRIVDLELDFNWTSAAKTIIDRSCARQPARRSWAGLDPRETFNTTRHTLFSSWPGLAHISKRIEGSERQMGFVCPPSISPAIRLPCSQGRLGWSIPHEAPGIGAAPGRGEGRGNGKKKQLSILPTRWCLSRSRPTTSKPRRTPLTFPHPHCYLR